MCKRVNIKVFKNKHISLPGPSRQSQISPSPSLRNPDFNCEPTCCNALVAQRLNALTDPAVQEALDILADPDVLAGLKHIKDLGAEECTDPIDRNPELPPQTPQTNLQMNIPSGPTMTIKSEPTDNNAQYMTEEAFDNMCSPRGKQKQSSTPKRYSKEIKKHPRARRLYVNGLK